MESEDSLASMLVHCNGLFSLKQCRGDFPEAILTGVRTSILVFSRCEVCYHEVEFGFSVFFWIPVCMKQGGVLVFPYSVIFCRIR